MIIGQQREAAVALHQTLDFLRYQYADDLSGYQGDNVQYILEKLRQKYKNASTDGKSRTKRGLNVLCFDDATTASSYKAPRGERFPDGRIGLSDPLRKQSFRYGDSLHERYRSFDVNGGLSNAKTSSRRYASVPQLNGADVEPGTLLGTVHGIIRNKRQIVQKEAQQSLLYNDASATNRQPGPGMTTRTATKQPLFKLASTDASASSRVRSYLSSAELLHEDVTEEVTGPSGSVEEDDSKDDTEASLVDSYGGRGSTVMFSENAHAKKLMKIAHILHYASIAILGVFVLQVRFSINNSLSVRLHCPTV